MSLRLGDYDYELPPGLIAQRPLERRDAARMMVLHRETQEIEHRQFHDLAQFIAPGDLLVLNDTRVLPARLFSDDGAVELLALEKIGPRRWKILVRPGRKIRIGATITLDGAIARVEEILSDGARIVALDKDADLFACGAPPLPPYLRRGSDAEDVARYQTVFAREPGAIAAPTAGLHFTRDLLGRLPHAFVTLHVGLGTFRPVTSETITAHKMHAERFSISAEAATSINVAGRVIAVGTTVVRVLEFVAGQTRRLKAVELKKRPRVVAQSGQTNIFIYPPFQFQIVDALLTNFHLPRSTLLMLVSAFAGREFILRAYAEAIRERYRFYSYGDCMLIL